METYSISLGGRHHPENQDRYCLEQKGEYVIAAVADGVGSTPRAGSVAGYFVEQCSGLLQRLEMLHPTSLGDYLRSYFKDVYNRFRHDFARNENMMKSGAAVAVILLQPGRLHCIWAGDVLAFHSQHQEGVYPTRRLTDPDYDQSDQTLTDWFGAYAWFAVNYCTRPVSPGDVITVCSDGAVLDEPLISDHLRKEPVSTHGLVKLAEHGIRAPEGDDVTILTVRV